MQNSVCVSLQYLNKQVLLFKHKPMQLKCRYINRHIDHFCFSLPHLSSRCFIKTAAVVQTTVPSFSQQR